MVKVTFSIPHELTMRLQTLKAESHKSLSTMSIA